jgi:hypothetical protein
VSVEAAPAAPVTEPAFSVLDVEPVPHAATPTLRFHLHVEDPLERVRLVALATSIAKEDSELLGPQLYSRLMTYLPTAIAPAAFRWLSRRDNQNKMMNVAVSNVPGPRERGHFAGAPVSELYSTGVLSAGAPVNITVWSYVDQLGVAVLTDDRTFGDVHEATDAFTDAFAEIRRAAELSEQPASERDSTS